MMMVLCAARRSGLPGSPERSGVSKARPPAGKRRLPLSVCVILVRAAMSRGTAAAVGREIRPGVIRREQP